MTGGSLGDCMLCVRVMCLKLGSDSASDLGPVDKVQHY